MLRLEAAWTRNLYQAIFRQYFRAPCKLSGEVWGERGGGIQDWLTNKRKRCVGCSSTMRLADRGNSRLDS